MTVQDDYFKIDEGDNWFARNKDALLTNEKLLHDIPIKMIQEYGLKPEKILEIGCSNGYRLNALRTLNAKEIVGIDVSEKAIEDGKSRYPQIDFRVGELANLPIKEEKYNLVIVNFVLHWIDRGNFFKAASEIDRVIADNGILVLGDFYPDFPSKVKYHHRKEDIYTYKMDYVGFFRASSIYTLIAMKSFNHDASGSLDVSAGSDLRGCCSILKKDIDKLFIGK